MGDTDQHLEIQELISEFLLWALEIQKFKKFRLRLNFCRLALGLRNSEKFKKKKKNPEFLALGL